MSNEIKNTKGAIVKEINGVKYFKLQSPYPGDYTKNCGLLSNEIDENFFFLRSYDIESASVDEKNNIVLKRVDGEELVIPAQEVPTFEINKEEGKLIITYSDGTVEELEGFIFEGSNVKVASDFTLKGDGRTSNPLRISEVERTGTYAPADFLVDLTDSANTMPDGNKLGKGARIVTKEYLTPFGLLYNYYGVEKIKEALEETGSKWRVPSRKDWAELLNAAEYCDDDRNHDTLEVNEWTGNWAGARAKAISSWEYSDKMEDGNPVVGIDNLPSTGSYGTFHLIPLGYGEGSRGPLDYDEDFDLEGLKLITSFWTSTPTGSQHFSQNPNIFTRTFSYETRKVLQESSKPSSRLSLRLVRDFDFDGFNEYENILGNNIPCVLVSNPDLEYNKVWTAINIGFTEPQYSGVSSSDWDELENEEDRKIKELYYVNEWNGLEWVKKPMNPGDSIVILDYDGDPSTSGDTYHEWRVYETSAGTVELIDTAEALKEEFRKELDEINERIDELSASTVEIREDLEDEIDRATSAETILAEAIEAEEARAISAETILQEEIDSIEVREVEPTDVNTFKSYNVFVNNEKRGATIDIPKDKNIKSISTGWSGSVIDEQTGEYTYEPTSGDTEVIRVVYQIADGTYRLIEISIDDFIHENEFKDGLIVEDHVVKVLINPESDEYLTVDENGILLSGVTSRFNELQEELDNTQKGAGLADDGSYVPSEDSRYIASAESIHDATIVLDDELDRVEQKLDDEIERSKNIDDNIAKELIGASGNSEDGYDIDFYEVVWEDEDGMSIDEIRLLDPDYEEKTSELHGTIGELPDAKEWHESHPNKLYLEIHDDSTDPATLRFYKVLTSNNYVPEDTTIVDAIKVLDNSLKSEEDARVIKDNELQEAIESEEARAISAETVLQEEIEAEVARATAAEDSISGNVTTLSGAVEDEIARAIAAEESISGNVTTLSGTVEQFSADTVAEITRLDEKIDAEIERATAAEESISGNVTTLSGTVEQFSANTVAEVARLDERIDNEIERATAAEESISGNVTTLSGSVEDEIARAIAEDERLDGQDIVEAGNEASLVDGITLKRKNGEEEIKININTNFGLLPEYE